MGLDPFGSLIANKLKRLIFVHYHINKNMDDDTNPTNKIPDDLITQTELARIRGVSVPTVNQLIKKYGVPRYRGGKVSLAEATEILAACVQPNKQRMATAGADDTDDTSTPHEPTGYSAWRARRERAAALKAEAEYERSIGKLVHRDDVENAITEIGNTLNSAARDFATSLAPLLAEEKDPRKIKAILDERIYALIAAVVRALQEID